MFRNRSELNRHENIHSRNKPYECKDCGMKFAQKGQLKNHTNTHTGERPFDCSFCGEDFNDTACKSRHEREQHSNFGGFRCPVPDCGNVNKRKDGFANHLKKFHGVSDSSVDPWQNAVTIDGRLLDPTKGLHEQLEWDEPKLFEDDASDADVPKSKKGKGKRAAAPRKKRSTVKQAASVEASAAAPKTRSSKRRRADDEDEEGDGDEEEYKPTTRARPVKRLRKSAPVAGPSSAPATSAPVDDAFAGLYTISPHKEQRNGVEDWGAMPSTSALQAGEAQFSFDMSTHGYDPASGTDIATSYFPQNALGLSIPAESSTYLGYSSTLPGLSVNPPPCPKWLTNSVFSSATVQVLTSPTLTPSLLDHRSMDPQILEVTMGPGHPMWTMPPIPPPRPSTTDSIIMTRRMRWAATSCQPPVVAAHVELPGIEPVSFSPWARSGTQRFQRPSISSLARGRANAQLCHEHARTSHSPMTIPVRCRLVYTHV
ncbi:uncharacterized protein B0H18DRAFT_290664 [Fomitopsis serialis]|uniref:uncharacterized protein n=1 Tax=Fomitopsis serialis TaxID=139415 RepID=UPI00200789E3|nr:uncharacterized protein B0H18DRAFT_290664 [Neoantrodia serialis]KAH9927231.1 hypothetical protein B0H18DRAFT_290664 [Neoantrodia serialis]